MAKGLDANVDCSSRAACLVAHEYRFVARYYAHVKQEPLTRQEAKALCAAGLYVVAVWENGFPDHADYFTHSKGVDDGTSAYEYAKNIIGQPENTPIYFTVDFDPDAAQVNSLIKPYFQGIRDGFDAISKGSPMYPVGVYGSGLTCSACLEEGLVRYTWLAMASGWRGFHTFADWNLKQSVSADPCHLGADDDASSSKGGGGFIISS